MSKPSASQILRLLNIGDTIHMKAFDDVPESSMLITEKFEEGVGGTATFYDEDEAFSEYGELYTDNFDLIYRIDLG